MNDFDPNSLISFPSYSLKNLSPAQAGELDARSERLLRNCVSQAVATMHSSTVLTEQRAIAIIGESGRGKTTLALACSQSGMPHMGDEFGYVSLEKGICWHAEYPLCLKESSPYFQKASRLGVPAISPNGIPFMIVERDTLVNQIGGTYLPAPRQITLAAFIFPRRNVGQPSHLETMPISEWSQEILISMDADLTRHALLYSFIRMVSSYNIPLFKLNYGEAADGASLLSRYFGPCAITQPQYQS